MKHVHLKKKKLFENSFVPVILIFFFFWNVYVFSIVFLRLEAVRVENRGGLKNIAQTLMARGTVYKKLASMVNYVY